MSTTPTPPVVDIGEPASNTSTTRPGRVDQQPRPHHLRPPGSTPAMCPVAASCSLPVSVPSCSPAARGVHDDWPDLPVPAARPSRPLRRPGRHRPRSGGLASLPRGAKSSAQLTAWLRQVDTDPANHRDRSTSSTQSPRSAVR